MAEPFTIYKLTILYMLSKAGFPLSNTQISNFFLEQEYTDYFRVQEVIGDRSTAMIWDRPRLWMSCVCLCISARPETFFKDTSEICTALRLTFLILETDITFEMILNIPSINTGIKMISLVLNFFF